jgi:CheY-like chemotaxis protein
VVSAARDTVPREVSVARVLIIEDDRDIRDALADILEVGGYEVARASNGAEGLVEARRHHPDVILLDLMMPVMDGWQFRIEQKRDSGIADVPVVILSAFGNAPETDCAAFLRKPCSLAQVLETVQSCQAAA